METNPIPSFNKTSLLHTLDIKINAAMSLNNQNITSSTFVYIAEVLGAIASQAHQGDYIAASKETKGVINLAYLEAKYPPTIIQERIILEALVILLESLVLVLGELDSRK